MIRVMTADVGPLREEETFRRHFRRMPDDRQEKILRLRQERDRRLSLGAGILLREALKLEGLEIRELRLERGEHEKPCFPEIRERFQFNLSHSGSRVLCMVSADAGGHAGAVGCDLEQMDAVDLRLARRFFSPEEADRLEALESREAQRELFYRLWTLKESFLKATGAGLSGGLAGFTVELGEDGSAWIDGEAGRGYQLGELNVGPEYKAAWCAAGEGDPPRVEEWIIGEAGAFPVDDNGKDERHDH